MPSCAHCASSGADKRCGACKVVYYCDRSCQKQHHKVHKKQCARLANEARGAASSSQPAQASRGGLEMDDEDIVQAKQRFDAVCEKYNLRSRADEMADFLTADDNSVDTQKVASTFDMSMEDANAFLIWLKIGTQFKRDVLDKSAQQAQMAGVQLAGS